MKAYKPTGKEWGFGYRRNRSLLHGAIYCQHLAGKGYYPVVRFSRDSYFTASKEGEGEYFFFDKNELEQNNQFIQEDMDSGRCTPPKLRELSEKFFSDLFKASSKCKTLELSKLSNLELLDLFREFRRAFTIGPIFSVQLWGVDACFDPNYKLIKFLEHKLADSVEEGKMFEYTELLSATKRKLVPVQQMEDFLRVCALIQEQKILQKTFLNGSAAQVEVELEKFPKVKAAIDKHIKDYAYVSAEFRSPVWTVEQWINHFKEELDKDCKNELENLLVEHEQKWAKKQKLLKNLNPPSDVLAVIEMLEEFLWQRDWSKAGVCKAFLEFRPLLSELAKRMNCSVEDVGNHSPDEIEEFLATGIKVPTLELQRRKKFCIGIYLNKEFNVYTKNLNEIIETEGLQSQFVSLNQLKEVSGVTACKGTATGIVRVVLDAKDKDLVQEREILVTYMTTVEFTPVFKKIAGLVTDEGGMSSHAAIVSREFGVPCIIGTRNATKIFKTGDKIEVDAVNGVARKVS